MKRKYSTFHGLTFYFMGLSANGVNRWTKTIKRAREGDSPSAPLSQKSLRKSREGENAEFNHPGFWVRRGGLLSTLSKINFFSSGDKNDFIHSW